MLTALQTSFFLVLAMVAGAACAMLNGGLRHVPAQMFHGAVALTAFTILAPLMLTGEPATVLMAVSGLAGILAFACAAHLIALAQRLRIDVTQWRVTPFSFACAVLAGAACGIASVPALACGLLVSALIFVARTDTAVHGGLTPDMPGVGMFCSPEQRAAIYPAVYVAPSSKSAPVMPPVATPAQDFARKSMLEISAAPVFATAAANDNDSAFSMRLALNISRRDGAGF